MKKILVALLVLALGMPLMAEVAVTAADMTGGHLRITVSPTNGAVVRGVALVLENTDGAIVASTAAVTATGLNTFIDFALTAGAGYTAVGQGHPGAKWNLPGGEAAFPADSAKFSLCAGYLDEDGDATKGEGVTVDSFFDVFFDITVNSTINISLDTIRGSIVGDTLGAVTVQASQVLIGVPPVCVISGVTSVKAVNPGFVNTDVTSVAAGGTSSLGHTLAYSFNWGAGAGAPGAATQTNTYAFTAAGTETVNVTASCTQCAATPVAAAPLVLVREAVRSTATFYNDWKISTPLRAARPACWAAKRQCRGDADGLLSGTTKTGFVAVYTLDIGILSGAWNIKEPATGTTPTGPGVNNTGICADFDHLASGTTKTGFVRVYTLDMGILSTNWNIKEPATGTTPSGPGVVICPASNVNFYTN